MLKRWEIALLLFAFVLILFGVWVQSASLKSDDLETIESFRFHNGDLLFLAGTTFGEKLIRRTTGCPFSHVGLIVLDDTLPDNPPFLLEADVGQNYKEGPRILPLKDKLEHWKGEKTAAIRKAAFKEIPTSQYLEALKPHLEKGMDLSFLSHWTGNQEPSKMFCSQLVASVLQDVGVLQTDKSPVEFSPGDFYFLKELYSEPKWVEF